MRFEQLQYLAAVPQYGSLRRASEPLHVSVPALSEGISRLERELGVTLLDRQRSGARISTQGREILPAVIDVLEAVDRLRAAAQTEATQRPHLRIGAGHGAGSGALATALRRIHDEGHAFSSEIHTIPGERVLAGVSDGSFDVGLLLLGDEDDVPSDLVVTPVAHGRPVAIVPSLHPLAESPSLAAAEIRRGAVIAITESAVHRRIARALFGKTPPRRLVGVDSPEVAAALAANGVGIAVLLDLAIIHTGLFSAESVTVRPLTDVTVPIRLVAVHRPRTPLPVGLRTFLRTLRALAPPTNGTRDATVDPSHGALGDEPSVHHAIRSG